MLVSSNLQESFFFEFRYLFLSCFKDGKISQTIFLGTCFVLEINFKGGWGDGKLSLY